MSVRSNDAVTPSLALSRRILAIDDNREVHEAYRNVLLNRGSNDRLNAMATLLYEQPQSGRSPVFEYEIDSAYQGQQGLGLVEQAIREGQPYSVVFVDVRIPPPGCDGITTAKKIRAVAPDLPIVLCTASPENSWIDIYDEPSQPDSLLILKKPFDPIELQHIAAAQSTRWHLQQIAARKIEQLEKMIRTRTRELELTRDLVFSSLAKLAESRDPETGQHLARIQHYTRLLAEDLRDHVCYRTQLNHATIETIVRSSVLHDIGKVGIPDHILLKPGRLTPDEFEIMKQHASIGARTLESAVKNTQCPDFLKTAAQIARFHHERYDGTGYPSGLTGHDIPLAARIVAVADVFDALTSNRVYKNAMPAADARELINAEAGQHFDPVIVEAFNRQWEGFRALASANQAACPSSSQPADVIPKRTTDIHRFRPFSKKRAICSAVT